jgi:hypothetical protein
MTPKKQAEMLINKFNYADEAYYHECFKDSNLGKICALVAVDELIKEQTMWQNGECNPVLYWQDVKNELEKL